MPLADIEDAFALVNENTIIDQSLTYYFASSLPSYAVGTTNLPASVNTSGTPQTYVVQTGHIISIAGAAGLGSGPIDLRRWL